MLVFADHIHMDNRPVNNDAAAAARNAMRARPVLPPNAAPRPGPAFVQRVDQVALNTWEPLERGPEVTMRALRVLRPALPRGYAVGRRLPTYERAYMRKGPDAGITSADPSPTLRSYQNQPVSTLSNWISRVLREHGDGDEIELKLQSRVSGDHIRHTPKFTPTGAILVLAGIYRCPSLFRDVLFMTTPEFPVNAVERNPNPNIVSVLHTLGKHPLCDDTTLREVVHYAVSMGVASQAAGADGQWIATMYLDRAHHLVAGSLRTAEDSKSFRQDAKSIFKAINNHLGVAVGQTVNSGYTLYSGILTGLCVASAMRFCDDAVKRNEHNKMLFEAAINAVGAGLSAIPKAGGPIAGIITAFAPLLAERIFNEKDVRPALYQLGAAIEDRAFAKPEQINPVEFARQLEKTMRHCGFPY